MKSTAGTVSIGSQLRRRREAADRSEPLPASHRDPLDAHRAPPAIVHVLIDETSGWARLRCPAWGVLDDLLARLEVPSQRARKGGGRVIRSAAVPDVLAYAEVRGIPTRVKAYTAPAPARAAAAA